MMVFAFYLFAISVLVAGFMVVISRNPVHSVLWLILAFLSAAGLFVLQGAEFVAMLLIIVYVGAVAVLFVFVVMMLDIDFAKLREDFARYFPLGLLIALAMISLLGMAYAGWHTSDQAEALRTAPAIGSVQNTHAIGMLLYDRYLLAFQLSGLILLVAMIGAIVLTMRHRRDGGTRLLAHGRGTHWKPLAAADVNAYLAELFGGAVTAKDFRTWHATVIAADALGLAEEPGEAVAGRGRRLDAGGGAPGAEALDGGVGAGGEVARCHGGCPYFRMARVCEIIRRVPVTMLRFAS